MTCQLLTSSIGLAANFIGAILIFVYGIPPKLDPAGHQHLVLEQVDEQEKAKAASYIRCSKVGVGLLILGFALQLASNFI
jgi:hypothetical protein